MSGIFNFLGGLGKFMSYISEYFRNSDIRNRQERYDSLLAKYNNLVDSVKSKDIDCESKIKAIKIEYDAKIQSMIDDIDEVSPDTTPRRIEG